MYYLIETPDQFAEMREILGETCYIDYVYGNDNTHPALAEVIAIYVSSLDRKGFILPINHPECMNLDYQEVRYWLRDMKELYVKDKKAARHTNTIPPYTDIQHRHYIATNTPFEDNFDTQAHKHFYRKFPNINVNKMIPIGKHFERCEARKHALIPLLSQDVDFKESRYYDTHILNNLFYLENTPIQVNDKFDTHFDIPKRHSIKEDCIYGSYNPYTTTGRPVNNFNGVNFMNMGHKTGVRESFEPTNDLFIEIDYDGYHPRLIADLVDFSFEDKGVHNTLAEIYFDTDNVTDEQYKKSKEITFQQIYGGIRKEYTNHPFFKKAQEYIDLNWELFNANGYVETSLGKKIRKEHHPDITPQRLFNYLIQATETETNMDVVFKLTKYLRRGNKKTKLCLYVYDSFLIDYSHEDGVDTLLEIKQLISEKFPVKMKKGTNYNTLEPFGKK